MELKETNIIFHDTETTGIEDEDRIIESAFLYFDKNQILTYHEELNKAPLLIKPAAAMVHGYTNSQVKDKPLFQQTKQFEFLKKHMQDNKTYYVAHNAPFDLRMLKKEGIEWDNNKVIDTLQVVRHIYKDRDDIEMHALQYLRYFFEFDEQKWFQKGLSLLSLKEIKPHTAMSDIFILWMLFKVIQNEFNLTKEDMVRLTQTPVEEKYIKFGNVFPKENKITFKQAVQSTYTQYGKIKKGYEYLDWVVNNMDISLSREFSIKKAIAEGIIEKKVPLNDKYKKYLYYGILYHFDNQQIEIALKLLNREKTFVKQAKLSSLNKFNEFLIQNPINDEKIQQKAFMANYLKNYRLLDFS